MNDAASSGRPFRTLAAYVVATGILSTLLAVIFYQRIQTQYAIDVLNQDLAAMQPEIDLLTQAERDLLQITTDEANIYRSIRAKLSGKTLPIDEITALLAALDTSHTITLSANVHGLTERNRVSWIRVPEEGHNLVIQIKRNVTMGPPSTTVQNADGTIIPSVTTSPDGTEKDRSEDLEDFEITLEANRVYTLQCTARTSGQSAALGTQGSWSVSLTVDDERLYETSPIIGYRQGFSMYDQSAFHVRTRHARTRKADLAQGHWFSLGESTFNWFKDVRGGTTTGVTIYAKLSSSKTLYVPENSESAINTPANRIWDGEEGAYQVFPGLE